MRNFKLLLVLAVAALLSACATPTKMAINRDSTTVDLSKESLALLSVRIEHPFKPGYVPDARVLYVEKPDAQNKADRFNILTDDDGRMLSPTGSEFLYRISLPPGTYVLRGVGGTAGSFPIMGHFLVPIHATIELKPQKAVYLGRVAAVSRERKENEFRAGPPVPLIDQSVAGFSGATWDVTISDNHEADMSVFRTVFPALRTVQVDNQVLPSFDRQLAQQWWEQH